MVRLTGKRAFIAVLAVLAAALMLVGAASGTQNNYWGYNNISSSNPPSHTCDSEPAGVACAGWNYWDYSQIDRASSGGGHVAFGFRFCSGCLFALADTVTGGTYTLKWNDPIFGGGAAHYNRPGCAYSGGPMTYVQCRALIFP